MHGEGRRDDGVEGDESTGRYPEGSPGYFAGEAPGDERPDDGARGAAGAGGRKFWERLGFESFDAYMAYLNEQQARSAGSARDEEVPVAAMPGAEAGDLGLAGASPPADVRHRQVNVKLRGDEKADLDRAARRYGVAPTTLARMLVTRGVRAILDA